MKETLLLTIIYITLTIVTFAQQDSLQYYYSYRLTGTILDANSQPVSKARLCSIPLDFIEGNLIPLCTKTDENGKYDYNVIGKSNKYRISVLWTENNSATDLDELREVSSEPIFFEPKDESLVVNLIFPDKAENAAKGFYQAYLQSFSFSQNSQLAKLRPNLSPELYSLLKDNEKRIKDWKEKKTNLKSSAPEDFFSCNRNQSPKEFHITYTSQSGDKYFVHINFSYTESFIYPYYISKKPVSVCRIEATMINSNGKWLVDNITLWGKPDLKTILTRKYYETLSK